MPLFTSSSEPCLRGVKDLREDFRRSEDKSDASRASVHRRMDELVERVGPSRALPPQCKETLVK
jgi:hypothetical protein